MIVLLSFDVGFRPKRPGVEGLREWERWLQYFMYREFRLMSESTISRGIGMTSDRAAAVF